MPSPDVSTQPRRGLRPAESDDAGPSGRPGRVHEEYGKETHPEACVVARGGDVREDERRARIMAAVTEPDTAEPGELARRLCRYAVDEMALSGCALVLMSGDRKSVV
jgi:hypothetical protein